MGDEREPAPPDHNSEAVFETERLLIRRAALADAPMYYELWTDPRVVTNVGFPKGIQITIEEVEELLCGQRPSDFGRLLVATLKSSGEVIGECKMYLPNDEGISETDVKLLPRFWGHRFGVEIKRGLVDYLFTNSDCAIVQATPNVNNAASINMQEAVGGVRVGEGVFEFPEQMREFTAPVPHYVYHVFRETWEESHARTHPEGTDF